jgi:ankyrin repeat protein
MNCSIFDSIENGDVFAVQAFLDAGGDVETVDPKSDGCTLLMCAVHDFQPAVVKLLLARGAKTTCKTSSGWTPLMEATLNGRDDIIPSLSNDALDLVSNEGETALMIAAMQGFDHLVPALATPTNVRLVNRRGHTALDIATEYNHWKIVEILTGY